MDFDPFNRQDVLSDDPALESFEGKRLHSNKSVSTHFCGDLMNLSMSYRTYNSGGGHIALGVIGDFLAWNAPDFGSAISEIEIYFHFLHSGPPLETLGDMFKEFHAKRSAQLPKVMFNRKQREAHIHIASDLINGKDLEESRKISLPLFQAGIDEVIAALELLKERLKPKDDFNLEAFLSHCREAQLRLPKTFEELEAFHNESKKRWEERRAAQSPWELLDIDWSKFHKKSRTILDDPFYWDCAEDFAPHGNDTGADLLDDYLKWFRKNPKADPLTFYLDLIQSWGFSLESDEDMDRTVRNEAAVALAFAELKYRADCRPSVLDFALKAIEQQRQMAVESVGWAHKQERLKTLDMLESKLNSLLPSS